MHTCSQENKFEFEKRAKLLVTSEDCLVDKLTSLRKICDSHSLWHNPLLIDCSSGKLSLLDFQFLFSQYYLYSKNFTRLIAALMVHCEDDLHRSKLSANLWEEGGQASIDERHAEIFRRFLTDYLGIASLERIEFEEFAYTFFKGYLNLCLSFPTLEVAAALSFGTEGIVSRLYTIFRDGLREIGISEKGLFFFNLHIETDDNHALTIEEIALSFSTDVDWFNRCKNAMIRALDLRDAFFHSIYYTIKATKPAICKSMINLHCEQEIKLPGYGFDSLICNINSSNCLLYENINEKEEINFKVTRFNFSSDILDSRLVKISPGYTNELHRHAHETFLLVLEGSGIVEIGEEALSIKKGDVVYVPRWMYHQTKNVGEDELRFFAVTDYRFTKRFANNTDLSYRRKSKVCSE